MAWPVKLTTGAFYECALVGATTY